MRTNAAAANTERTFEGAPARIPAAPKQLERQVATCLLWENTFYEKGSTVADEIAATCRVVDVGDVAAMAVKARNDFKLRHVPLFLLAHLDLRRTEKPGLVAATVEQVVQRPDEMGELLSIIRKVDGGKRQLKKILSAQIKKGLARTFRKFNAYQLAKWNRDSEIKLRDVLFLCHAKPKTDEQKATWPKLINGSLEAADTWEVALSAGSDKKATWERLLTEGKLGYMALLMNLRNMTEAKVDGALVERALLDGAAGSRALPFRFVSALKHAPAYAQALSDAMVRAIDATERLSGTTLLVLDVSGSMNILLSQKGTLARWEAAGALGVLLREVCESVRVFTFSNGLVEIPNLRGLPLIQNIGNSQPHQGTYLANTLQALFRQVSGAQRVIVVTDEQTHDGIVPPPDGAHGYIVNVAPYRPGLDVSGRWKRVNGFSERLVDWIRWEEVDQR